MLTPFDTDWCDYLTRDESRELIKLGIHNENASFTMVYRTQNDEQISEQDLFYDADGKPIDGDDFSVETEILERWRGEYDVIHFQDDAPIFSIGDMMRVLSHSYIKSENIFENEFQIVCNFAAKTWCVFYNTTKQQVIEMPTLHEALYHAAVDLIKHNRLKLKDD